MSVSTTVIAKYKMLPDSNEEKLIRIRQGLFARWGCAANLNGDGSAGDYIFSVDLAVAGSMFGQYTMWNIDSVYARTSGGVLVAPYAYAIITPNELFGGDTAQLLIHPFTVDTSLGFDVQSNYDRLKKKWRLSEYSTATSGVQFYFGPNTNLRGVYMMVFGKLYDERYIVD